MTKELTFYNRFLKEHRFYSVWIMENGRSVCKEQDNIWNRYVLDMEKLLTAVKKANNLIVEKCGVRWWQPECLTDKIIYLGCRLPDKDTYTLSNIFDIKHNEDINILNRATSHALGYNGYKDFTSYLKEKVFEEYYNGNTEILTKDKFTDFIINEINSAWKEISNATELKQKKKAVQKRVQKIESDVDNEIINLAEEFKCFDVSFKQESSDIQSISTIYNFEKSFNGYNDLHCFKLKVRKTSMGLYDMSWFGEDYIWNKKIDFKKDTTADQIIAVIKGIFGPYLNIPADAPKYIIPKDILK